MQVNPIEPTSRTRRSDRTQSCLAAMRKLLQSILMLYAFGWVSAAELQGLERARKARQPGVEPGLQRGAVEGVLFADCARAAEVVHAGTRVRDRPKV